MPEGLPLQVLLPLPLRSLSKAEMSEPLGEGKLVGLCLVWVC